MNDYVIKYQTMDDWKACGTSIFFEYLEGTTLEQVKSVIQDAQLWIKEECIFFIYRLDSASFIMIGEGFVSNGRF